MGRHLSCARHHPTSPQRQPPTHLEQPPVRACPAASGRRLRNMRIGGPGRGAPHSCPQRPQPQGAETPTRMGHADGCTPPQDPCRLPRLPRRHPRRTSCTTSGSEGGRRKRTRSTGTSSAAYPTASTVLRRGRRKTAPPIRQRPAPPARLRQPRRRPPRPGLGPHRPPRSRAPGPLTRNETRSRYPLTSKTPTLTLPCPYVGD